MSAASIRQNGDNAGAVLKRLETARMKHTTGGRIKRAGDFAFKHNDGAVQLNFRVGYGDSRK